MLLYSLFAHTSNLLTVGVSFPPRTMNAMEGKRWPMHDRDGRRYGYQAPNTGAVQHQEIGVGKRTLIDATFAPRVQLTGRSLQLQPLQPHRVPGDERVHIAA